MDVCNDMGQCEVVMIGDNCGNFYVVDVFFYMYDGDMSIVLNIMGYGDGECVGETYGEGEVVNDNVFMYEVMFDMFLMVLLDFSIGFDLVFYVVMDCGDVVNMCVGADEGFGDEELSFLVVFGQIYYIVVDGYNSNVGQYNLNIIECPIICDVNGVVCGDDGCGGICGECVVDEVCSSG